MARRLVGSCANTADLQTPQSRNGQHWAGASSVRAVKHHCNAVPKGCGWDFPGNVSVRSMQGGVG